MSEKNFKIGGWEQKTPLMKCLTVAGFIISAAVLVLAFLQIFNFWDKAINIFEPLLGVLMLIQAIENRKTSKIAACISLFAALFVFIAAIIIIF